jgi:hypothetical protein
MVNICGLGIFALTFVPLVPRQNQSSITEEEKSSTVSRGVDYVLNYLNMAGTEKASEFRALTRPGRTKIYLKTMVNSVGLPEGWILGRNRSI